MALFLVSFSYFILKHKGDSKQEQNEQGVEDTTGLLHLKHELVTKRGRLHMFFATKDGRDTFPPSRGGRKFYVSTKDRMLRFLPSKGQGGAATAVHATLLVDALLG